MKTIYICKLEIQKRLNQKPNILNLCVCDLEHINTIYLYQDLNNTKLNTNRSLLIELFLQADSIQTQSKELDSIRVLDAILTASS